MSPYFKKGTITASIYQQPQRQGQMAVRLLVDSLTGKVPFPPTVHLSPGVVMSSNLHLFREIRLASVKFDDAVVRSRTAPRA
jgi:LacI family transcriptional regulator